MVIERFKAGHPGPVGERFRARGRMLPEGAGVEYLDSWMTPDGDACHQLMRAPARQSLDPWLHAWSDLVDFEVVAVVPSAEFWAKR